MQEMKFKFAEEKAYISKASEVDVRMVQRRCQVEENTCNSSLQVFCVGFNELLFGRASVVVVAMERVKLQ